MREELDVGDRELSEVLAHVVLGELGRQPTHKDARRLHCMRNELWPAQVKATRPAARVWEESCFAKKFEEILASLRASAPIGRGGRAVSHWPAAPTPTPGLQQTQSFAQALFTDNNTYGAAHIQNT